MPAKTLYALVVALSLVWVGIVCFGAIITGTLIPNDIGALFASAPAPVETTEAAQDIARLSHRLYRVATLQSLVVVGLIAIVPPAITFFVLRHQINRARP